MKKEMKQCYSMLIMIIFFAAITSCASSDEKGTGNVPITPCIAQLPISYSLLPNEKIIDLADIDGDGKGDAFAFCQLEGKMEGFAMHLSKNDRMVYSEFEEFSGWGESINRKVNRVDNKIVVVCNGLFIADSLILSFDEGSQEMFFDSMNFSHYTRDHEISREGKIYFENGNYFCEMSGNKSSKSMAKLKIDQSAEFLALQQ